MEKESHNCSNCYYYKKNLCQNFKSPLSYEEVDKDDFCKKWEAKNEHK